MKTGFSALSLRAARSFISAVLRPPSNSTKVRSGQMRLRSLLGRALRPETQEEVPKRRRERDTLAGKNTLFKISLEKPKAVKSSFLRGSAWHGLLHASE